MKIIINEENKNWDSTLIQLMWRAWKARPRIYSDANAVSMQMQIDNAFKSTGIEEPDSVGVEALVTNSIQITMESRFGMINEIMSVEKAKDLRDKLNEALADR